jgi:protein-S-isoprenylcysteine O-methyltransferase Ste14
MSWMLVFLQLALIAALLLTGPWLARQPVALGVEGLAALLGAWAVLGMRRSRLRVTPEVAPGATLVTAGPYRWIRHPMYAAVLLMSGALVADAPSPLRVALWLLLAAVLSAKLVREERFLRAHFPGYADYARTTARLLPGLW